MFDFLKRRRRDAIREQPFPEAWRGVLDRDVAYVAKLGEDERAELEGLVQIFLAEKHLEGCGGLELTDEIRVTIAAQACLLLLGRDTDVYPELETVLVYPHAYRAPSTKREGFVVIESDDARLGESWTRGVVVLAWDHVSSSARQLGGDNVVLHEFAHQLDAEDGSMDGAPDLGSRARFASWARVLGEEFEEVSNRLHAGRPSDIDAYGATSPPEFFAVVTEMFFEKPHQLRKRHPELYAELAAFYKQDPAAR
jgi:Mlc titration factor MtfA (ptsG expression regulator)